MAKILNENFEVLKQLFTDCLSAKNNPKDSKINLDDKIKAGSLTFVLIKKVNRLVKYKVRSGREELQAQKSLVDCNRLHLQNLLYEVNYLKREIKQCYKFKSQDEDIDIYEQPEQKALAEAKLTHKERIARLERELDLRKKLSDDCDKLLKEKEKVFHDIIVKMENLSTFAPSLKTLLKATRPLQEALQLPIEEKWKLEHRVHLLPQHLYLTYVNLRAIELLEGIIELSVQGQEEDVKEFELKICQEHSDHMLLLKPHPLSLQIKFKHEDFPNDFITVDIYFLPLLMIATAHCEIFVNETNVSMVETNLMQDFLDYIGEEDAGNAMPYSECSSILQKHNLTVDEFQKHIQKNNIGKPYLWIQQMSGNSRFSNTRSNEMQTQELKDFTLSCMKRIRSYMHSRLVLISQIRSFMNKNLEEYINKECQGSPKPNCTLVQWSALSYDEYKSSPATQPFINAKLVNSTCFFFRAVLVLGSAKMECLISTSNKFPLNKPLWTITIHWNGHHDAISNASIKVMEHYTNSVKNAKKIRNLLAHQLLRTMYSFDIFLETEGPLHQPQEYTKEKSFKRPFSRCMRMRPIKRVHVGSADYFKP